MRCDIDDARIFLQVIRDRRNPLEVLREGLSNSYDASASRANAIIRIRSRRTVDVEIHDNGLGIRPSEFRYFFGLGFGNKIGLPTIGNKGLGTKLFFNSDGIEVSTKLQSGGTYEATLESPLQTLENGIVPRYNVHPKREVRLPFRHGTSIRIRELRANSQSPLLSIENIANYLRWFTVAGSCRRILGAPEGHRFAVKLIREGSLQEERLVDGHELPGLVDPRTDDYLSFAESFDPFIIELHDDVGETLGRLEVAGAVVGPQGHFVTDRRIKKRYKGVFLAKDYFIVRQINDEVFGGTGEWQNVHIIANCQDLELAMNRDEFLESASSPMYQEVLSALRSFANALRLGERFRYRGRMVEDGPTNAGACYQRLKLLRSIDRDLENRNLKGLDLLALSTASGLSLTDDGGPAYEPLNSISVGLVFQALVSKHEAFWIRTPGDAEVRFRVLGYSIGSGGHLVLQKRHGTTWSRPLFFKLVVSLKEASKKEIAEADGIICWTEGLADPNQLRSLDIVVLKDHFGRAPVPGQ